MQVACSSDPQVARECSVACSLWQGGVSRVALGTYTADLSRDVEGVAVEVVNTTSCLPKWRFGCRRSKKGKKERSGTKTEPLLVVP